MGDNNNMKIGIVGPSLPKWKSKEQIDKAKREIERILVEYNRNREDAILVSGHCPKGGVDTWAEIVADSLGVTKEIYPAEVNKWEDKNEAFGFSAWIVKKGYKSRNIQIAEACDVLYCIVPHTAPPKGFDITNTDSFTMKDARSFHCIHCKKLGHPTNGGCWTMNYAKKLGKETYLIVIE